MKSLEGRSGGSAVLFRMFVSRSSASGELPKTEAKGDHIYLPLHQNPAWPPTLHPSQRVLHSSPASDLTNNLLRGA